MNLRLDTNSIRFRVELSEAQILLQDGMIEESLPWGESDLTLKIHSVAQARLFISPFRENCLEIFIPKVDLESLLSNTQQKAGKASLELKSKTTVRNKNIEIRFEIDHFSAKQNQTSKKGEITND